MARRKAEESTELYSESDYSNLTLRISGNLKDDYFEFCDTIGIYPSTLVFSFIKKTIDEQRIPFDICVSRTIPHKKYTDTTVTFSVRLPNEVRNKFNDFCEKIGLPPSSVAIMFIKKTVDEQRLPYTLSAKKEEQQ